MSIRFHSYQPFPKPLPPVPVTNQGPFCFQVDGKWIPYLLGAISILAVDSTWESDVYRASGEARNLLAEFAAATGCEIPDIGGTEMEDCMGCCIRWNDGVLEVLNCGEWQPVPGTPGGVPGPGGVVLPPSGGQPGPGECREYNLLVQAYTNTLLPVTVSTGDTVTVSAFKGAWSDSFPDPLTAFWYCATGNIYALGFCAGAQHTEAGDPLPTSAHMGLIAEVGGIAQYFDCTVDGITFTVPPGVTDEQVLFLANDATPADNQGGVSFHVKVCRGATSPLSITYTYGTGPAAANLGEVVTLGVQDVGSGNYGCKFDLDRPVKMTILATPGYANTCGGSITFSNWFNPSGSLIGQLDYPAHTSLLDFPNGTVIQGWAGLSCTGGAPFNVQVRFDEP